MNENLKIPKFKELLYHLNPATGYYEKQAQRIPFNKIPFELKVEETQDEKIKRNGAAEIIRGRIKKKKFLFFTGMIPTQYRNIFRGDHYEFRNGAKKKQPGTIQIFSRQQQVESLFL